MSYILDALKKSDQQRQLGNTPTLQAAPVLMVAHRRISPFTYGLLTAALLGAGVVIGLLRPWQAEQVSIEPVRPAAEAAASAALPPVPVAVTTVNDHAARKQSAPDQPLGQAASPMPDRPVAFAEPNPPSQLLAISELPAAVQRELPEMTVQMHAYSAIPTERLVSINSIRLREGGSLMLGLRLEQITPDGMIFSYKGYRFQRGIR